ncbi:hypothetical protein ABBQ32_010119 [Trebouxia sp. C0010 RCD-2024]
MTEDEHRCTDREAVIQIAFDRLEKQYPWMVKLVCQAHGFSLLIKDLLKEFTHVGTLDTTIRISNFENNHAWFRRMLHGVQKLVYGRILEIMVQAYGGQHGATRSCGAILEL